MGFWGDFGGRGDRTQNSLNGWKVHPFLELRVFRYLWSRSDAPYSRILYGYSHLP